jgi:site-specific DNA-methyltransferase (adenine-specific)
MSMIRIENIDCLELLKTLPDNSVDLMLQDPPYGVTQNEWDNAPDLSVLWPEWLRVCKDNAAIVFTAQQPFSTDLINSNRKYFRYDLIWEKSRCTGFLNANRMPMRSHEHILIFYKELPTFNPQKTKGNPNHISNGKISSKGKNNNYGNFEQLVRYRTEDKFPKSVIFFEQNDPNIISHPTQKPIDLMRYLIRTYSNPGDMVFDGYSGSGTVADACLMEGRNCIAAELNKEYYEYSIERLQQRRRKPELFTPTPPFSA